MADLFILLFDAVSDSPNNVRHGKEGYIFAENGEHSWYDISKEIARVLYSLGISPSAEPSSFTTEELIKYWGSEVRTLCAVQAVVLSSGADRRLWVWGKLALPSNSCA